MNRQQRRQRANKRARHAPGASAVRRTLLAIAMPPELSQLNPELQRGLRRYADFLLTIPTSQVSVAKSSLRRTAVAVEWLRQLLPNPTNILQNPTTSELLAVGLVHLDFQVPKGPNALTKLLDDLQCVAATSLSVLLERVERRLEALKDDPTPLGLTGESAEMFSKMFEEHYGTIEDLVELTEML